MRKKVDKQIFFFFITKNSNWESLTKNFVTFKRLEGVNDEKLWWKTLIFLWFTEKCVWGGGGRGGDMKNQYRGEGLPKKRGLASLQI